MAIKVTYSVGMAWSLAFSSFLAETFGLAAVTPSGIDCKAVCVKYLALRIKTLKGRLPVKDKESESKGTEKHTSTIDWANAVGKKSTLSPFERLFALVLRDYGDFVDYGLAKAVFSDEAFIYVKADGKEETPLLPHDGTVRDLWAWAHERAIEEIAQAEAKAKEDKAKDAKEAKAKEAQTA